MKTLKDLEERCKNTALGPLTPDEILESAEIWLALSDQLNQAGRLVGKQAILNYGDQLHDRDLGKAAFIQKSSEITHALRIALQPFIDDGFQATVDTVISGLAHVYFQRMAETAQTFAADRAIGNDPVPGR